jgi:hypothetical protein
LCEIIAGIEGLVDTAEAEHLKIKNEVVDQNRVITRLRLKREEDDNKVHMAKIRDRNTQEIIFGTLVIGICIVYALCAPFCYICELCFLAYGVDVLVEDMNV